MEDHNKSHNMLNNILFSLLFTVAYGVLLFIYNEMPLDQISNFRLKLFIVCGLVFTLAAIFFAAKSYKEVKKSSIILIIINSLGLLIPLALLLVAFT